jgi:putative hydrolase of the HAD superfamily
VKVKAVIFDLFGTLVDGFATSASGYQEKFSAALGVDHEAFTQLWREITGRRTVGDFQTVEDSIKHVCDRMGVTVSAEQRAKAVEIRLELTRRALTPRSDAISTVARLKRAGLKIGLLSNCSIEIPMIWPETAFAEFFDSTIFSSRERIKKPDPRIYKLICDRLAMLPEACVYIADGENYELAAAADVGMHPVLIRNPEGDGDKLLLREARDWKGAAVSSLTEVVSLVTQEGPG